MSSTSRICNKNGDINREPKILRLTPEDGFSRYFVLPEPPPALSGVGVGPVYRQGRDTPKSTLQFFSNENLNLQILNSRFPKNPPSNRLSCFRPARPGDPGPWPEAPPRCANAAMPRVTHIMVVLYFTLRFSAHI